MTEQENALKGLFGNEDFVILIDTLAKRYGKTPSEILCHSTIFEFNLDVAVMITALYAEKRNVEEARTKMKDGTTKDSFSTFGIKVKTINEPKTEAGK